VQAAFFILFVAFVLWPGSVLPGELFFRADPLAIGGAALAAMGWTISLLFALGLLLLTLVGGRLFCGWACPLGTCIDLVDAAAGSTVRLARLRRLKLHLLVLLGGAAAGGVMLTWALDPMNWAARIAGLFSPGFLEAGWLVGLALALVVLELALGRRGFCRVLCPLGALLGVVARFSLYRRDLRSPGCTDCGSCVTNCPAAAIGSSPAEGPGAYLRGECIHCRRCEQGCAAGAVSFRYFQPTAPQLDRPRRDLLLSLGGGAALAVALRTGVGLGDGVRQRPGLRPPGSVAENALVRRCIRCGSCLRICPTRTLTAAGADAGLLAFQTPLLVPRLGGCRDDCNACGEICPSGAIRPLPLPEKRALRIGQARIDRQRCLPHARARACLVCLAACPFEAIRLERAGPTTPWGDPLQLPAVDTERCTGCGLCEAACPLAGEAAVRVVGIDR
jgi:ferredoxin